MRTTPEETRFKIFKTLVSSHLISLLSTQRDWYMPVSGLGLFGLFLENFAKVLMTIDGDMNMDTATDNAFVA